MKRLFTLLILFTGTAAAHAQTLITYGSHTVSVDEFLRAYNKNKIPVTDKERSLREYISLYTNFKLKVQAAAELHLDTMALIRTDIENFRNQVEENYMSDDRGRDALIAEAIDRGFSDLHILYFSVPVDAKAMPADTMNTWLAIKSTYEELQKGNIDYAGLSNSITTKYAPVKYNDVGFVTAFSLPYQFENIVYSLKPGEVSKPYRTRNAWHVFKLAEVRKSIGTWKVAQVLFSISPTATEEDKRVVNRRADSVYNLLLKGAEFSAVAKQFSEDKLTYMTGGELPEFSTGKYDYSFEKEVLKLKSNGELTKPFLSPFGYHIVKRLGHTPQITDKADPTLLFDTKQKVMKDARIESIKQQFSKAVAGKTGLKITKEVKEADLLRYADSVMKNPVVEYTVTFPISNKKIIRFNKGSLNASDWLKFVVEYKGNFDNYKGETNKELWDKYIAYAGNEYYKNHLENYNDDFKYQMKEFKEGNMLFEIMERNVWGLANSDSAGLLKHYSSNRSKYIWPASADVLIFNCTSEKVALEAMEAIKKGNDWKAFAEANSFSLQVDSGRYELSQLVIVNNNTPGVNSISPMVKNADGTAIFVKYILLYPGGEQRSFEEAKGLVINDYQNVLEEKWLESLRKKYPVKINNAALQTLLK